MSYPLKNFAPRSLYGRFLMIIILPTVLAQMVAVYMFYERHWSSMARNMSSALSQEIAYVVHRLEDTPGTGQERMLHNARTDLGITIAREGSDALFAPGMKNDPPPYNEDFETYIHQQLGDGIAVAFAYPENDNDYIYLRAVLPDNHTIYITAPRKRLANPSTYIFILWMTGTASLLLFVSVMFLKNQVRSIVRLTEAAEKFGTGQDLPDFKPTGAQEVRRAAIAFIEMRERIKRLLTRRTQMLAAVSHDLRTPLTRMRLQLELLKDKKTASLKDDLTEMEKMLEGYLDFARGESDAKTEEINLARFVEGIVAGYPQEKSRITSAIPPALSLRGQSFALKRCFCNLIENALRYAPHLWISTEPAGNMIAVLLDDDGAGIPYAEQENVFQPFYRLERSRNAATGGVGLGLSIVRDILHRHGGDIRLETSPRGGLRVRMTLPA